MLLNISRIGLVLNIIGSLFIAFSFGKNLADAHQTDKNNKKIFLASFLHPSLFRNGIVLIILGFLLMLIATFF